jgi:hypothetical protein
LAVAGTTSGAAISIAAAMVFIGLTVLPVGCVVGRWGWSITRRRIVVVGTLDRERINEPAKNAMVGWRARGVSRILVAIRRWRWRRVRVSSRGDS